MPMERERRRLAFATTLPRRGFLGAIAALPAIAAIPAVATAAPPTLDPNDARLVALADAYVALDRQCAAHSAASRDLTGAAAKAADDIFDAITDSYLPIEEETFATPADTLVGVLAKARLCQSRTARESGQFDIELSAVDDLHRIFGGRDA